MELADTEISDLANFMGHAEKIHRAVYRQPIISRDILNITQLLEAAHGCNSQDTEESSTEECNGNDEEDREGNKETTINEASSGDNAMVHTNLLHTRGHGEKIHREVYRQPIISRDILNITQVLEAAHGCDSQDTEESSTEECNCNDEEDREGNKKTIINEGTNDGNSSVGTYQSENVERPRT